MKKSIRCNTLAKILVGDERLSEEKKTLSTAKHSLVEVIDDSNSAHWCGNIRRKIKAGVWCSDKEYIYKNIMVFITILLKDWVTLSIGSSLNHGRY